MTTCVDCPPNEQVQRFELSVAGLVLMTTERLGLLCRELLAANLPADDLYERGSVFFDYRVAGKSLGFGGLQRCGRDALLRSVVVPSSIRGQGAGTALVRALMRQAQDMDFDSLWLLTTSAEAFFSELGFHAVDRDTAPARIRATAEFSTICPRSAACMMIDLHQ